MCIQRSDVDIKNIGDEGTAKLLTRVGGQDGKTYKLNVSAKDIDVYFWNFLDKY